MKLTARRVFNIASFAIVFSLLGLIFTQVFGGEVLAQVTIPDLPDPVPGTDLETWVQDLLNLIIGISALIAVAVLIYSGIIYITAAGDEGKISSATKGITFAIIGLIIAFISVLIVNFVLERVLNVQ